ncbi:MAG: hypothetical protein QG632_402 [Candidatus Dependentiae bacterium]|nr:hypothetical protein [Candidatus Dependentiae bacterium]
MRNLCGMQIRRLLDTHTEGHSSEGGIWVGVAGARNVVCTSSTRHVVMVNFFRMGASAAHNAKQVAE